MYLPLRLTVAATLLATVGGAFGTPVTAKVHNGTGSIQKDGGSRTPLVAGTAVEANSTITTSAADSVLLAPLPGIRVRVQSNSRLKVLTLDLEKKGEQTVSREASLRLEDGTISFGINKVDPNVTHFTVDSPWGTTTATGASAGTAGALTNSRDGLAVYDFVGELLFAPLTGPSIQLHQGEAIFYGGTKKQMLVNLIEKTVITWSASGEQVSRLATAQELDELGKKFAEALQSSQEMFTPEMARQMRGVIAQVNLARQSAGLAALDETELAAIAEGAASAGRLGTRVLGSSSFLNPSNRLGNVATTTNGGTTTTAGETPAEVVPNPANVAGPQVSEDR